MTAPTTTRPARTSAWSAAFAVLGLGLAVVGLVALGLAVAAFVDARRNPESWGDLAMAALVLISALPATGALVIARVQAGKGWAPRAVTRTTTWLAAPPVAALVLLLGALVVGSLLD